MFKRAIAMSVAAIAVASLAAQSPAAAAAAAAGTGPGGVTITQGQVFKTVSLGPDHVEISLNTPYQWLDAGHTWSFGNVDLVMQADGNLVLYRHGNHTIHYWDSGTAGSHATQLLWQADGNLVLYTAGYAQHPWASNTNHKCAADWGMALGLQTDSNMVIYCYVVEVTPGGAPSIVRLQPVWATNTAGV
jgi:hypothetical protein